MDKNNENELEKAIRIITNLPKREQPQPAGAARQGGITSEKSDSQELIESFLEASSASLASQSQAAQPTDDLLGVIARGWCAPENSHKQMDSALVFAIGREVAAHIAGTSQAAPVADAAQWRRFADFSAKEGLHGEAYDNARLAFELGMEVADTSQATKAQAEPVAWAAGMREAAKLTVHFTIPMPVNSDTYNGALNAVECYRNAILARANALAMMPPAATTASASDGLIYESVSRRADPEGHAEAAAQMDEVLGRAPAPSRDAAPVVVNGQIARRESIAANHDAMIILTQSYPREAVIRVVDAHTERNVAAALTQQSAAPSLDAVLNCYSPDDTAGDYQDKIRQLYAAQAAHAGAADEKLLADSLNMMMWLYRRLPVAYGKPPFVDAAIMKIAERLGFDDVPIAIRERAAMSAATDRETKNV